MSLPTVPYLYNQQQPITHDVYFQESLEKRFGAYNPCGATFDCPYNPVKAVNPAYVVSPPCCPAMAGTDVLGIGSNQGILDYQFGSSMDVPFCGVPMQDYCGNIPGAPTPTDCKKCPCKQMGCANVGADTGCCDYGFARNHSSIFGPSSGGRSANPRWG